MEKSAARNAAHHAWLCLPLTRYGWQIAAHLTAGPFPRREGESALLPSPLRRGAGGEVSNLDSRLEGRPS